MQKLFWTAAAPCGFNNRFKMLLTCKKFDQWWTSFQHRSLKSNAIIFNLTISVWPKLLRAWISWNISSSPWKGSALRCVQDTEVPHYSRWPWGEQRVSCPATRKWNRSRLASGACSTFSQGGQFHCVVEHQHFRRAGSVRPLCRPCRQTVGTGGQSRAGDEKTRLPSPGAWCLLWLRGEGKHPHLSLRSWRAKAASRSCCRRAKFDHVLFEPCICYAFIWGYVSEIQLVPKCGSYKVREPSLTSEDSLTRLLLIVLIVARPPKPRSSY